MPLAIGQLLYDGVWPFPHSLCRVWISVDVVCCTASIVTLCAIAIDRFLAITIPFQYPFVVSIARVCGILVYVRKTEFYVRKTEFYVRKS